MGFFYSDVLFVRQVVLFKVEWIRLFLVFDLLMFNVLVDDAVDYLVLTILLSFDKIYEVACWNK